MDVSETAGMAPTCCTNETRLALLGEPDISPQERERRARILEKLDEKVAREGSCDCRKYVDDHGGDIGALKEAEPWLFVSAAPTPAQPKGKTSLPNAGASHDGDADVKRWRRIAGLDE